VDKIIKQCSEKFAKESTRRNGQNGLPDVYTGDESFKTISKSLLLLAGNNLSLKKVFNYCL
jgi:hypothetical protein